MDKGTLWAVQVVALLISLAGITVWLQFLAALMAVVIGFWNIAKRIKSYHKAKTNRKHGST